MPERRSARPHVHKFGGASLADGAGLARAAAILSRQPAPRVVVASAMAGVTDALLAGAREAAAGNPDALRRVAQTLRQRHLDAAAHALRRAAERRTAVAAIEQAFAELDTLAHALSILRELTPRSSDHIVARGERLSARLVAATLACVSVPVEFVDATEVVRTNGAFGNAVPDLAATDRAVRARLAPLLARGVTPVVPGFLGRAPDGATATLGRGGSDLTATILARALRAVEVTLWKDVPGFLTADPRIVPEARVLPRLDRREAAELAYYGAKVLHPRALIPLAGRAVPIRLRAFNDPEAPGTEVSQRRPLPGYPVQAISSVTRQTMITVAGNGMLGVPGVAARTFGALHQEGISVSLISQASSEHSICFTVPEETADRARAALESAFGEEIRRGEIDGVETLPGLATIAVVGLGMSGTPGISAQIFTALARGGVNVVAIAQGSSELNVSFVVDAEQAAAAVRRIHGTFQLDRIGGGGVEAPATTDVVLLGFGQIGRELTRMLPRARSRSAELRIVAVIDRAGHVFDPKGLSPRRLTALAAAKAAGRDLARAPGGQATPGALHSLSDIARHALTRPILVDLTADDTTLTLRRALESGMHLVLANKRPLAGPRAAMLALQTLADSRGLRILHETTVGAGLPVIDTYYKLVESGDRVLSIEGCTSGTLGFVLSEIGRGRLFSEALTRAMSHGYTEPDPRDDLSGLDVARKALILGRLLGFPGELSDVAIESLVPPAARRLTREEFIGQLTRFDADWQRRAAVARAAGQVLRYVSRATARRVEVGISAVPASSPFAALEGTDNQLIFVTRRYKNNPLIVTGPGAGPAVTAAGVLNDLQRLASLESREI